MRFQIAILTYYKILLYFITLLNRPYCNLLQGHTSNYLKKLFHQIMSDGDDDCSFYVIYLFKTELYCNLILLVLLNRYL